MIKVLHIVNSMNIGGLENVVRSILLNSDKKEVVCDCLICGEEHSYYEKELMNSGVIVYKLKSKSPSKLELYKELLKFFRAHKEYTVVHAHMAFTNGIIAAAASTSGIKNIIVHSHGVKLPKEGTMVRIPYEMTMRFLMGRYSTRLIGCSEMAGKYLFGEKWFKKKGEVFLNSILVEQYKFSNEMRIKTRRQLNVENKIILGTVGSISAAKNQIHLLKILNLIKDKEYAALIVGDGPGKAELLKYTEQNRIGNKLILTGKRDNVIPYLNAMDVFVFPSLSEGFGVALLEAQANGLPCVVSDRIQNEAKIAPNIYTVSLDAPVDEWISTIQKALKTGRSDNMKLLKERGLDAQDSCENITAFYKRIVK